MKNLFRATIIISLLLISVASCKKPDLEVAVPDCIEKKIKKIRNKNVGNPPVEVWEWKVDGMKYYYFTSECCDQYNYLYDDNCNEVCAPDGGFTGAGVGNCPDFTGEVEKTLVWEDDRG